MTTAFCHALKAVRHHYVVYWVLVLSLVAGRVSNVMAQEANEPKSLVWYSPTLFQWYGAEPSDTDKLEEPLVTDRPDFTEASTTVGLGVVQLETGYTFSRQNLDGTQTDNHAFAEQLWRIGILADWLEFRIGTAVLQQTTKAGAARDTITGMDDLYLGFKFALTEQAGILPEMALVPQCTVATGNDAFTAGEFLSGANWLYGWDINDCLATGGSTQWNRAVDDDGHDYMEFAQSATFGISWTERVATYSEWFAFFPHSALTPGTTAQHYLNGGMTFLVNDNLQLDIRSGFGLSSTADDFFTGAGVSRRW